MSPNELSHDALCAHLRSLELALALLDPATRRDRSRVAELLAEDFEEFGSSGRVWSRAAILELLATEEYSPPAMENFRCVLLGEAVALVTYRTLRTDADGSVAAVLRSSLWVRESGTWRVRFHQGTRQV